MHRYTKTCLAAIACLSFSAIVSAAELSEDPLSKVKKNIDEKKAVLVDVREKQEWERGHVEGAKFLPLSKLKGGFFQDGLSAAEIAKKLPKAAAQIAKELPKEKRKILYIHCVIGKRALAAANLLERHGYRVRPIKPGYKELVGAGCPKAKE